MKREGKNTMRATPTTNIAMATTNTPTKGTERTTVTAMTPTPASTTTMVATADTQTSMMDVVIIPTMNTIATMSMADTITTTMGVYVGPETDRNETNFPLNDEDSGPTSREGGQGHPTHK